jgi:GxxExxY protein
LKTNGDREGREHAKVGREGGKMDVYEFRGRKDSRVDSETEDLTAVVIDAAMEVHSQLGPGLPESVYRKALSHELDLRGILHECEAPVPIFYKEKHVGEGHIDILVAQKLIVELKCVDGFSPIHRAQCISYLQATKLKLALLINFNAIHLKDGIKRVVNTY